MTLSDLLLSRVQDFAGPDHQELIAHLDTLGRMAELGMMRDPANKDAYSHCAAYLTGFVRGRMGWYEDDPAADGDDSAYEAAQAHLDAARQFTRPILGNVASMALRGASVAREQVQAVRDNIQRQAEAAVAALPDHMKQ